MAYSFPAGSSSDGFGDDVERYTHRVQNIWLMQMPYRD